MVYLYLDSLNQQGESQPFCLGSFDLNSSFETITLLVDNGCQLLRLELHLEGKTTRLPVEAFDGKPMLADLKGLQQQWEAVLATH